MVMSGVLSWQRCSVKAGLGKEVKVNKDIIGPVDKVTDVMVDLGPRLIMAGIEVLGTADNISILVTEATEEELEKLKAAYEIRLVKMPGESGPGEQTGG